MNNLQDHINATRRTGNIEFSIYKNASDWNQRQAIG